MGTRTWRWCVLLQFCVQFEQIGHNVKISDHNFPKNWRVFFCPKWSYLKIPKFIHTSLLQLADDMFNNKITNYLIICIREFKYHGFLTIIWLFYIVRIVKLVESNLFSSVIFGSNWAQHSFQESIFSIILKKSEKLIFLYNYSSLYFSPGWISSIGYDKNIMILFISEDYWFWQPECFIIYYCERWYLSIRICQ